MISKLDLPLWILIAAVTGLVLGSTAPGLASLLEPAKELLLNGMRLILAPLAFATIISRIGAPKPHTGSLLNIAAITALLVGLGAAASIAPREAVQLLIFAILMGSGRALDRKKGRAPAPLL